MPKLNDKQERLLFFKVIDSDKFDAFNFTLYCSLILELYITYDYAVGDHIIADWSGFTLSAMKTLEPSQLQKFITIHQVRKILL